MLTAMIALAAASLLAISPGDVEDEIARITGLDVDLRGVNSAALCSSRDLQRFDRDIARVRARPACMRIARDQVLDATDRIDYALDRSGCNSRGGTERVVRYRCRRAQITLAGGPLDPADDAVWIILLIRD